MQSLLTLGKSRIEALSDGIFAISMTLLVLKLEVPPVMHHASNAKMLDDLLAMRPAFETYVLTFLIAGGFWLLHHLTFHFIRHVSSVLLLVNLVLLMLVSLLPFSAGLVSHFSVHPVSQAFYFGNQLGIALLLGLHWEYAKRKEMVIAGGEPLELVRLSYRIWTAAGAFAAAMAAALLFPEYSGVALILTGACGIAAERWANRKRKP